MRRAYLLSTLSMLSMIGCGAIYGAYVVEATDVHHPQSVCEVNYEDGDFGVKDTHGKVHKVPLSLVQGMRDIPLHQIEDVLSSHAGWLDVKELHEGGDSDFSLRFNFRLRGGRPIPKSGVSSYQVSSLATGGGERSASEPVSMEEVNRRIENLRQELAQLQAERAEREARDRARSAEIERLERELAKEKETREREAAEPRTKIGSEEGRFTTSKLARDACVAAAAGIGSEIVGKCTRDNPIGKISGATLGGAIGSVVCEDRPIDRLKDGIVSAVRAGLRTFDEHIRAAALEREREIERAINREENRAMRLAFENAKKQLNASSRTSTSDVAAVSASSVGWGQPGCYVLRDAGGTRLPSHEPIRSERERFMDRAAHSPLTPGYYALNHRTSGIDRGGMSFGYDSSAGGFSVPAGDRSGGGFEPDRSHGAGGSHGASEGSGDGGSGDCVVM